AHVPLHAGPHLARRRGDPRLPPSPQDHPRRHRLHARVLPRRRLHPLHPPLVRLGQHPLRRTHRHPPPRTPPPPPSFSPFLIFLFLPSPRPPPSDLLRLLRLFAANLRTLRPS